MLERIGNEKVIDWQYISPIDNRKSFYGKAVLYETDKYYYLQSYETLMGRFDKKNKVLERLSCIMTRTTNRHLDSFFYGLKEMFGFSTDVAKFYESKCVKLEEDDGEWFEQFKKDYESLHPEIKKRLAHSNIMVHSKEQAEELMKFSKAFSIMMEVCEK